MAKILLVEDNPEARLLVQYMLGGAHSVSLASDSRAALDLATAQRYDAVLMDINLGDGLDGVDLLNLLRERPAYANVPVVALTAYAQPGDEGRFRSAGFTEYVSKPFTRAQLQRALATVLPQG
jgi:CheY-like chemotaxis protein